MTKDKEWRICWVDGESNHVLFTKPDFIHDKYYTKFVEHQALVEAKAENERLRGLLETVEIQKDFAIKYLNPEDTSFRDMIDTFRSLSADKQSKMIDLVKSLKALEEKP